MFDEQNLEKKIKSKHKQCRHNFSWDVSKRRPLTQSCVSWTAARTSGYRPVFHHTGSHFGLVQWAVKRRLSVSEQPRCLCVCEGKIKCRLSISVTKEAQIAGHPLMQVCLLTSCEKVSNSWIYPKCLTAVVVKTLFKNRWKWQAW